MATFYGEMFPQGKAIFANLESIAHATHFNPQGIPNGGYVEIVLNNGFKMDIAGPEGVPLVLDFIVRHMVKKGE